MRAIDSPKLNKSKSKDINCPKQISQIEMTAAQLKEFLTQMEELRMKEDAHPKKILQILKIMKIAQANIAAIEFT